MRPKVKKTLCAAMVASVISAVGEAATSITVVTSHSPGKSNAEVSAKGYLSTYIEIDGRAILFDTGKGLVSLRQKLDGLGLEVAAIEAVVFSHNDLASVRDLSELFISADRQKKVYVPSPMRNADVLQNLDAKVVEVFEPVGVLPDAWLVGPMSLESGDSTTVEQLLVLDRPEGLVVIVGCSHPGVVSVVKKVREVFGARKIKLVAGGFHLQATSKADIKEISLGLQRMGIDALALSSCTGETALKIFRKEWRGRVVSFDSGDTIRF